MSLPSSQQTAIAGVSTGTLPIHRCIAEIQTALREHSGLILEAAPGAGKTTIVPLALLNEPWLKGQKILMLQPRRVAARAAAARMATLLGEPLGESVGFEIRQERKLSHRTRIVVMTEGVLARRLQQDPALDGVGLVIFDEFHERHLDSDLSLAFCLFMRNMLREENHPLKLLVMSATLDGTALSAYLDNAPVVRSDGRLFAIEHIFSSSVITERELLPAVVRTVRQALHDTCGDILIFLPGQGEIKHAQKLLEQTLLLDASADSPLPKSLTIVPLYGGLSFEAQQQALTPCSESKMRKIILATDIAETSLTIEGVSVVIDSGLSRVPVYDPASGLTRLTTRRISKASAAQRAGRAGRLKVGTCYRLWTQSQHQGLIQQYPAEIHQADLCSMTLQLFAWGIDNLDELTWLDRPPQGPYQQALSLLENLGAIAPQRGDSTPFARYTLTPHGRQMALLPMHPRLAHMMMYAASIAQSPLAANIAALLSERDPLTDSGCDFQQRIAVCQNSMLCPPRHRGWLKRVQHQSRRFLQQAPPSKVTQQLALENDHALAIVLASAYPDRIARRIDNERYKMANGRIATLPSGEPLSNQQWLIAVEVGGFQQHQEDRIFSAAALDSALFDSALSHLVSTRTKALWDTKAERFVAEEVTQIGAIVLRRRPLRDVDRESVNAAICEWIRSAGLQVLPWTDSDRQWQQRVLLARSHEPEAWPDVSDSGLSATLEQWLCPFLAKVTNLATLRALKLGEILSNLLDWQQQIELKHLAPPTLVVPSGSEITIDYLASPPVLAVKLQEMFGCTQTPCVIAGKVPLMVHLLSPARRPLQITQDLVGFWQSSYHDIKKEMRGRYPKHPWPDDPNQTPPTRATKRALANKP